jgi:hypothetical protein
MKPEAGRHPSNPIVERSWDAVFFIAMKKKLPWILNFLMLVSIFLM